MNIKNQFVFFYSEWNEKYIFSIKNKKILHQLSTVLRSASGDYILLLNGNGKALKCRIISITKKNIDVEPLESYSLNNPKSYYSIAIGTPKKESLKDILKYCTQLGVCCISLVESQYSQVKNKHYIEKKEYYESIIIESCEQSLQYYFPKLEFYSSWVEYTRENNNILIADFLEENTPSLYSYLHSEIFKHYSFCIGPEGGWSPTEREFFKKKQYSFYKLSNNILRVETAVISTASVVQTILFHQTRDE